MFPESPRTETNSSTNKMPPPLYITAPSTYAWRPLQRLMDLRFGPPPLSELLPDSDDEDQLQEEGQVDGANNLDPPYETTGDGDLLPNSASIQQYLATGTEQLGAPEGTGESSSRNSLLDLSSAEQRLPAIEEGHLTVARRLMVQGAQAPSCYVPDGHDLEQTPATMTGFAGAVELWPHQLAAVGRLVHILSIHLCALLAFDMGLGKTLIIIGMC
jgi:hypothetical protein